MLPHRIENFRSLHCIPLAAILDIDGQALTLPPRCLIYIPARDRRDGDTYYIRAELLKPGKATCLVAIAGEVLAPVKVERVRVPLCCVPAVGG